MSDTKKIIGVFTTKGGTGKSTIALNLSLILGEGYSTLFVDMDANLTIPSILLKEITTIDEVLKGGEITSRIDGTALLHGGNIKQLNERLLQRFWEIAGEYEYVVLDFHNSATPLVVSLLSKTDITIVPVVPTMAGMGAYIHTKKVLDRFEVNNIGVVNKVHRSIFGIRKDELEIIKKLREKGKFWDGYLPYDKAVALGELEHKPVAYNPKSSFTRALRKMCKEVIGCPR